ncbi:MAG: hypothetical protein ACTSV8_08615 [Candidatus Thorarchaeota archaeon]
MSHGSDIMGLLDHMLEILGHRHSLRGAIAQPNDLMRLIQQLHRRTLLRLTGKLPMSTVPLTQAGNTTGCSPTTSTSLVRRLARRGMS